MHKKISIYICCIFISVLFSSKYLIYPTSKEVECKFKWLIKKVHIDEKRCLGSIYIHFQAYCQFFSSTVTLKDMQNPSRKHLSAQLFSKLVDDIKIGTTICIEIPAD